MAFLIVLLLIVFGLVMVLSTSSYKAEAMFGNPAYWFLRQCLWAVMGIFAMMLSASLSIAASISLGEGLSLLLASGSSIISVFE